MKISRLIVDGYSLLHHDPAFSKYLQGGMDIGREHLLRKVEMALPDLAASATVVFDGKQGGQDLASSFIEVLYAPSHKTADTVIEQMVANASKPAELLVITADRAEQDTVSSFGAQVMSCEQFRDYIDREKKERINLSVSVKRKKPSCTLGELFPEL